ncbi:MAG: hypothetical protein KKA42_14400, partial [candidate division Zixibacteria bacterium]|nr:hypothetical protein [candidate division Zixibacteria bacterium]
MSHDESAGSFVSRFATFMVLVFAIFMSQTGPVWAQLNDKDIAELQQRAIDEGWTFTVEDNPACQYSLEQLCGTVVPDDWYKMAEFDPCTPSKSLPAIFDWRNEATLPAARNQGGCGSCWAFSTVGALECNIAIKDNTVVNLSEQWIVSCNTSGWDCGGGWAAHMYHESYPDPCGDFGAVLESDFPYTAYDSPCNCPYPHAYTIHSWAYIGNQHTPGNVPEIKQAIMEYGPVSVCVSANDAMQAYHGGIFNGCEAGDINHMVVLVGWDDTQGENGVWFMRNSWGTWWGESGYCRIPYNCSYIGYGASYVNYRPVMITPEDTLGEIPISVSFTADAPGETVDSCIWDYGDGSFDKGLSPSHEYTSAGLHTVTATVYTANGPLVKTCPGKVSAYADTMTVATVDGEAGQQVRVDIVARNYLPLKEITLPFGWSGPLDMQYDSFSTAGLRTAEVPDQRVLNYDIFGKRATVYLDACPAGATPYIAPDNAPIISLWFTLPTSAPGGSNPVVLTSYASFYPRFESYAGEYQPASIDGSVNTGCCINTVGNVQAVGTCNDADQSV